MNTFSKMQFFLDGKCSICGEDFSLKKKLFEKGGDFYRGYIVRTYDAGSTINVDIQVENIYG